MSKAQAEKLRRTAQPDPSAPQMQIPLWPYFRWHGSGNRSPDIVISTTSNPDPHYLYWYPQIVQADTYVTG